MVEKGKLEFGVVLMDRFGTAGFIPVVRLCDGTTFNMGMTCRIAKI